MIPRLVFLVTAVVTLEEVISCTDFYASLLTLTSKLMPIKWIMNDRLVESIRVLLGTKDDL